MPDNMPKALLHRNAKAIPDNMPKAMLDRMPEAMPDKMPEAMRDRLLALCQIECQKLYQIE